MPLNEQQAARFEEQIKTLFNDVGELKMDLKEIKAQLANRLPNWATVLIAVLTAAVGWFVGH
jgi:hypothetical protein